MPQRLANPDTLVITAADADHPSFGCRDKAKWTYFGDAFFNVALRQAKSLKDAFVVARALVQKPADRQCHPEDPGTNNRSAPAEEWNAALLRNLWPALNEQTMGRKLSVEHEEAWLTLAGFLLRPGFGFAHDGLRMDELWQLRDAGLCFPGKRSKVQEYILWRRVTGGLTAERQERLLAGELASIRAGKAPPELVRLSGSLERLPRETKADLIETFITQALQRVGNIVRRTLPHSASC